MQPISDNQSINNGRSNGASASSPGLLQRMLQGCRSTNNSNPESDSMRASSRNHTQVRPEESDCLDPNRRYFSFKII